MQFDGFAFRSIYLETPKERFDLHNHFRFTGFAYDISTRVLALRWTSNEYVKLRGQRRILVEFHGVTHLSCDPRDPDMPFAEDTCLSDFWCEDTPEGHYRFRFMSGFVLRVNGECATWRIE